MQAATQQMKKTKVWEDPQKRDRRLELILNELEALIKD